jgi:hypothetical protein
MQLIGNFCCLSVEQVSLHTGVQLLAKINARNSRTVRKVKIADERRNVHENKRHEVSVEWLKNNGDMTSGRMGENNKYIVQNFGWKL